MQIKQTLPKGELEEKSLKSPSIAVEAIHILQYSSNGSLHSNANVIRFIDSSRLEWRFLVTRLESR